MIQKDYTALAELLAVYAGLAPQNYPIPPTFKPIIFRQYCSEKLKTSPDFRKKAQTKLKRKKAAARKRRRGY